MYSSSPVSISKIARNAVTNMHVGLSSDRDEFADETASSNEDPDIILSLMVLLHLIMYNAAGIPFPETSATTMPTFLSVIGKKSQKSPAISRAGSMMDLMDTPLIQSRVLPSGMMDCWRLLAVSSSASLLA